MKKFCSSVVDTKTNKEILYTDCSFNMAMMQLEKDFNFDVKSVKIIMINNVKLTEVKGFVYSRNRECVFYYDEDRGYLLRD